jgi:hypothetical protein
MNPASAFSLGVAFAFCCIAIQPLPAFGAPQDTRLATVPVASNQSQDEPTERYSITISEYRLKDVDSSKLTTENIVATIAAQKAKPFETVMLSAIAGTESMVQFGRSVTVTTGRMTNRDVTTRQTQQRQIGTILRVTASPDGGKVSATLSFESSRHVGERTDDSPPDIATTSVNSTQIFDLGQPTLIAATTAAETSYVLITISRR